MADSLCKAIASSSQRFGPQYISLCSCVSCFLLPQFKICFTQSETRAGSPDSNKLLIRTAINRCFFPRALGSPTRSSSTFWFAEPNHGAKSKTFRMGKGSVSIAFPLKNNHLRKLVLPILPTAKRDVCIPRAAFSLLASCIAWDKGEHTCVWHSFDASLFAISSGIFQFCFKYGRISGNVIIFGIMVVASFRITDIQEACLE